MVHCVREYPPNWLWTEMITALGWHLKIVISSFSQFIGHSLLKLHKLRHTHNLSSQ